MSAWLAVLILGIVEGITEFLPVSSTGHLLLVERWLGIRESDAFLVIIQSGAALAVLMVFQQRLVHLLKNWRGAAERDYLLKLAGSFVITMIGGLALQLMHFKLPEAPAPVGLALLIGGVAFLAVERMIRGNDGGELVSWSLAIAIGLGQLLAAIFPGTSRSGATILIALLMGLSRPAAVEFTFLLGVPTLFAAGALKLFAYVRHPGGEVIDWPMLALCFVVSAVTAFAAVRWMLLYLRSHTFVAFGWYRILIGAAVLAPLLL